MKYLNAVRQLLFLSLTLVCISLPLLSKAQTTISVDDQVCLGEVVPYTPTPYDPSLVYTWTATGGTVLSSSYPGVSIQWASLSGGSVTLTITNPDDPGSTPVTISLPVTVNALPEPFVTSDVLLGCQPLDEDPRKQGPPEFDDENCQLVCAYSTVTYTAHGNTGSTFTWNVTGAVSYTASGTTCTVLWGDPGFGQVQVTETTTADCEAESSFCVQIVEKPIAKFIPQPPVDNPITICLNGEVVLLDASVGSPAIVNWHWDWGDGHITTTSPGSEATPVSHQYTTPGEYTITLTVTNACGCTDRFKMVIKVDEREAPKIACPRVVCEDETATYTINEPCGDNWEVIGGTVTYSDASRVDVKWDAVDPATGFGYVMYKTCEPCRMVVTEEVPVVLHRGKINGPDVIFAGEQYIYRMPKWPATKFDWSVVSGPGVFEPTDQRNEMALTATGVGTITIFVRYHNTVLGCNGSAQLIIKVLPQATITGDDVFCQGDTRTYSVGGAAADWTLRDAAGTVVATAATPAGTPFSYTFSTPGTYRLSASGTSFCPPQDFFIKVIATPAPPDMITGPVRACIGIPTRYEAGNPIAGTSYAWSTSSGTVDAAMGDYSYLTFTSLPATVQVVRVTTGEAHCASTPITKTVLDAVPPFTISGEDEPCHSTTETYTVSYNEGDSYVWSITGTDAGSVIASDNHSATVQWNAVGAPPATTAAILHVKVMKCGVEHNQSFPVTIKGLPTLTSVTLTDATICSGEAAEVNITTSFPLGGATGYTAEWGDGIPDAGFVPTPVGGVYTFSHSYTTDAAGSPVSFTPALTITNPGGCIGTITATAPTVTVLPRPAAVISPAGMISHCGTGWSETLTATETTGIGSSAAFSWSGPGGFTASTAAITATAYGAYTVTVSNTATGCSNTASVSINERCEPEPGSPCDPPPAITLTPVTTTCGQIHLTATPGAGSPEWVVPAGVTIGSSSATELHATAVAGYYTIRYRVYYGDGCHYDYTIDVEVPYVPDLRWDIACNMPGSDYAITLYDHSTAYPSGSITSREFFGPGWTPLGTGLTATTTQAPNTSVTYYEVISGGSGTTACTTEVTIHTPEFPTASIAVSADYLPGCVNDVVFTFDKGGTSVGSYWWDFGDGSFNASADGMVGKVYSMPSGTFPYTPSITVTDQYGCYATASTTVTVMADPYEDAEITAGPNPVCQGTAVALTYTPMGSAILPPDIVWYEQPNPIATISSAVYNVFTPGGYWAEGVGDYGCKVKTNLVPVQINQVPPLAISGNANQCVDQAFTLTTQNYGPGYTYTWSGPGAAASTGPSLTYTSTTPGAFTYTVTITDVATGCQSTSPPFTVTVSAPPPPPTLSFNVLSCQPYELQLTASGVAGTYNWSNGGFGPVITTPHGGPYQVTLTDNNGCRVESSFYTPRSLEEYLWVFPTGCFCSSFINEPYVIGPIIPLDYWAWHKNGAVDASGGGFMPDYTVTAGNVYNMELKNAWCGVMSGDMYYLSDTCGSGAEAQRPAGDGYGNKASSDQLPQGYNALQAAPNPATGQVRITYSFAPGSAVRSIELYDMTGRKLQSHAVAEESGSLTLKLDGYAAGLYQIVMKRDGVVVQQSKLSVTR